MRCAAKERAANDLINLLLAPDSDGNVHALARRMGVQEHIGLNWAGAKARTSFWRSPLAGS